MAQSQERQLLCRRLQQHGKRQRRLLLGPLQNRLDRRVQDLAHTGTEALDLVNAPARRHLLLPCALLGPTLQHSPFLP